MADAQPEVRVHVARRPACRRLWKACAASSHDAGPLQADRQVEPAHGVLRLHLGQDAVALGRLLEVAQFELDVAHRAIDLGRGLVGGDGALQLLERLLPLAGKVQGDRSRQMGLRSGAFSPPSISCARRL